MAIISVSEISFKRYGCPVCNNRNLSKDIPPSRAVTCSECGKVFLVSPLGENGVQCGGGVFINNSTHPFRPSKKGRKKKNQD